MEIKQWLLRSVGQNLREIFQKVNEDAFLSLEEIRLRAEKPVLMRYGGKEAFVDTKGNFTNCEYNAYSPSSEELANVLALLSRYSLYAYAEEIRNGFFTIEGGHRVGIAGQVVTEGGRVKTIQHISAINIRVSHEIMGCADTIIPYVLQKGHPVHTLILSPPGCGKTTLLRDLVRQISNTGYTVGVVDERGEIAGCYQGVPQNDVGLRTDVLDACPKAEGMRMLLRSMAPRVIAVDEIGGAEDILAIESIFNAGVRLFCTIHGNDLAEVQTRPGMKEFLSRGVFGCVVVLGTGQRTGEIRTIYDARLQPIYEGRGSAICC